MRFRIALAPWRNDGSTCPVLEYDYQHSIGSMFYHKLLEACPEYKELHDSKGFKFFTFSRIEIPRRKALPHGLAILSNDAYLWFSSADRNLTRIMAEQIIQTREIRVGTVPFAVVGVTVLGPYAPSGEMETFSTMSPVILRTRIDTVEGTKTWDLSPSDDRFSELLTKNLVRKYTEFHGQPPKGSIEVVQTTRTRQKRITILDTYHRAHLMDITLRGDPELLKFGYDCGLGEKNSMGFGMVRSLDDLVKADKGEGNP